MILDERLEFADAVALTLGAPATTLLGDVVDLTKARNLAGAGVQLYCVIQVDTPVTSADDPTLEFKLVSDAQAAIAVDGSATVHGATGAKAKAAFPQGATFVLPLPPEGSNAYERFLGVIYTVVDHALTAGKVNAFITPNVKQWKAYDDGR